MLPPSAMAGECSPTSASGAGNEQTGVMASKYDAYWMTRLDEISAAIQAAVRGSAATVDVAGVRRLGDRESWHGVAEVCGNQMTRSSMAHATSLGRTVAASGMCAAWPEHTFRLTIDVTGMLAITAAEYRERPRPAAETHIAETPDERFSGPVAKFPTGDHQHAGDSAGKREASTNHFYLLFTELTRRVGGTRRLRDCAGAQGWPRHGVYFFFEDGEIRADGSPRVVRIGTHALIPTSRTTLWNRLSQHRGHLKGRSYGSGNHRASVFRRHVGSALIARGNWPDGLLVSWLDRHHPGQWAELEDDVEHAVSRHIGAMPFLWLNVPEREDRVFIERNSIAFLSCLAGGQDRPSAGWLGHDATRFEIRESGLWNVQHVYDPYDPAFLQLLARLVESM